MLIAFFPKTLLFEHKVCFIHQEIKKFNLYFAFFACLRLLLLEHYFDIFMLKSFLYKNKKLIKFDNNLVKIHYSIIYLG